MGAQFTAHVVAGVRLSDVFRVVRSEEEVVRYDRVTGVPSPELEAVERCYLFGREIPAPGEYSPDEWAKPLTGLGAFDSGSRARDNPGKGWAGWGRYDFDEFVLGVEVAQADPERVGVQPFDPEAAARALGVAEETLRARGWEGRAQLYLVADASY
jgi:hypothetical protein